MEDVLGEKGGKGEWVLLLFPLDSHVVLWLDCSGYCGLSVMIVGRDCRKKYNDINLNTGHRICDGIKCSFHQTSKFCNRAGKKNPTATALAF